MSEDVRFFTACTHIISYRFLGDGSNKVFNLERPLTSQPSIFVNDRQESVDLLSNIGSSDKNWFWEQNSTEVRQRDINATLRETDVLEVRISYYENPMLCPRCYGAGIYLDLNFDMYGQIVTSNGIIKLQQDALKLLMQNKGSNVFHEEYGVDLNRIFGSKNLPLTRTKLDFFISEALQYLQNLQQDQLIVDRNVTQDELLKQVYSVEIEPLGPTSYAVKIVLISESGDQSVLSVTIQR